MKKDKIVLTVVLAVYFLVGGTCLAFQDGNLPHFMEVNGEKVIAYTNGIVYTNPLDGSFLGKHTLWCDKNGRIKSSFTAVLYNSYLPITVDATTKEATLWQAVQDVLKQQL